jgi:hypothetical protein
MSRKHMDTVDGTDVAFVVRRGVLVPVDDPDRRLVQLGCELIDLRLTRPTVSP